MLRGRWAITNIQKMQCIITLLSVVKLKTVRITAGELWGSRLPIPGEERRSTLTLKTLGSSSQQL